MCDGRDIYIDFLFRILLKKKKWIPLLSEKCCKYGTMQFPSALTVLSEEADLFKNFLSAMIGSRDVLYEQQNMSCQILIFFSAYVSRISRAF
jgi:hypothetical protein